jgi:AAHS family 3-hydroxyphenylpropionic acid transporter
MTRRVQVLLGASLLNWVTGNGLFPLLPLYALDRGATVEGAGMVLAVGFVGLAAGSLAATWLARVAGGGERAYVGAALLQASAYALMGRATTVWQLLALLSVAWLGAGLASTLVQVMAGLAVDAERRGRVFGLLALAPPLGALVGASLLGATAARGGYQWAFDGGALLVGGAGLLIALGMPAERAQAPATRAATQGAQPAARAHGAERALLLSVLLASAALFFGRLFTPVMMRALSFDPQAVAGTVALGGLVTAMLVPLIAALSDRLGRRSVLIGTYVLIAVASSVLAFAGQLWQFSLAAVLLSLGFAVSGSVSAALAGDLIPSTLLPRALGRLSASTWIAAVVAFGGGAALLGRVPAPALCLIAALLALGAGLSVGALGKQQPPAAPAGHRTDPALAAQRQA